MAHWALMTFVRKGPAVTEYSFHHIHHEAADVDVAAAFYVANFGGLIIERAKRDGGWEAARVQVGGCVINITDRAACEVGLRTFRGFDHIGIHTSDFDDTMSALRANGVNVYVEPFSPRPGVRIAFINGPDDVKIEVLCVSDS